MAGRRLRGRWYPSLPCPPDPSNEARELTVERPDPSPSEPSPDSDALPGSPHGPGEPAPAAPTGDVDAQAPTDPAPEPPERPAPPSPDDGGTPAAGPRRNGAGGSGSGGSGDGGNAGGGAGGDARPPDPDQKPGVREQLGRVREAARVLIDAHLALLRAEMAAIGEEVKQIAAFAGGIVALGLYAVTLIAIGGTLFVGEAIFGSIGWGVVHGSLLVIGMIIALALLIIEAPRPLIVRSLIWGVVLGLVATVVLGLNLPRWLSEQAADLLISNGVPLDPQYAPAVVAMAFFAIVVAFVGLLLGARSEEGLGAVQGFIVGALVGALFGLIFGGLTYGVRGAAAIGVTVGLIAWIAIMGRRASMANLDPQARFARLWPRETYETTLETKAWLEREWTNRLPRPGSK